MVDWSVNYLETHPLLVMGGFHLLKSDYHQIQQVIQKFEEQKVQYVAPSHCTGDEAIKQMHLAFQDRFIYDGAGRIININDGQVSYN